MNKVAERAGSLGLFAIANAIANTKLDPTEAPRDARLVEPPAGDLQRLFGQMARRGLDPELVRAVWALLERRPLERALVAVDVLASAVWSRNESLVVELRAAANTLAACPPGGEIGIDLNKWPATYLVAQHALRPVITSASTVDLLALAYDHHLGALGELHRRGDDLLEKTATRESIQAFARLASLAHLPTLASVYLDWLMRGVGWRVPALDLCETLFDAGVAHKVPATAIQPGDIPEKKLQDTAEYITYRSHISIGDLDTANALLTQHMDQRPRWIGSPSLELEAVRGHLGSLYGHSNDVTLPRIELACEHDRLWRYAAKVRAIVAAKRQPARAIEMFHAYISSFGNDYAMTYAVLLVAPEAVKRDVARILAREAFYLPHEPSVWKLLGVLGGVAEPVASEVDARLRSQTV